GADAASHVRLVSRNYPEMASNHVHSLRLAKDLANARSPCLEHSAMVACISASATFFYVSRNTRSDTGRDPGARCLHGTPTPGPSMRHSTSRSSVPPRTQKPNAQTRTGLGRSSEDGGAISF